RSKRSFSGGNGMPRPFDSRSYQPAPMPRQARPSESTSRVVTCLTSTPGWRWCMARAARRARKKKKKKNRRHQRAQARAGRVRRQKAERRVGLEHVLLGLRDRAELKEGVHQPDRTEAPAA